MGLHDLYSGGDERSPHARPAGQGAVPGMFPCLPLCVILPNLGYLQGISDTPAWVVAKANEYARCHGKSQFVVYQGEWSVMKRSFERDIIPMARAEG